MFDEIENQNKQNSNNLVDDFEIFDKKNGENSIDIANQNQNMANIDFEKNTSNAHAEDIFVDTENLDQKQILKPGGVAPREPLTNYNELIRELHETESNKIKPVYFFIGVLILIIIIGTSGWWLYNKFFTKSKNTGEIILNTEQKQINLDSKNQTNESADGVNVNTSAIAEDADGDGLTNEEEGILKTDSSKPDTDEDGLADKEEVKIYHTDPLIKDTDGDSYLDGEEVDHGYSPIGPGKLFDFNLITNEISGEAKSLINPNLDTSSWTFFSSLLKDKKIVFNEKIDFKIPSDWSAKQSENQIDIYPSDESFKIGFWARDNKLELDLVDWLITQNDFPDFKQEQVKINNYEALVLSSNSPSWKAKNSVFINYGGMVYGFNYFDDNNLENNFKTFQAIVLSFNIK